MKSIWEMMETYDFACLEDYNSTDQHSRTPIYINLELYRCFGKNCCIFYHVYHSQFRSWLYYQCPILLQLLHLLLSMVVPHLHTDNYYNHCLYYWLYQYIIISRVLTPKKQHPKNMVAYFNILLSLNSTIMVLPLAQNCAGNQDYSQNWHDTFTRPNHGRRRSHNIGIPLIVETTISNPTPHQ